MLQEGSKLFQGFWRACCGARSWFDLRTMSEKDWDGLRDQALVKWQRLCSPHTANAAFLKGQLDRNCQTLLKVIRGKLNNQKGNLTKWDFLEVMASMAELRRRGHYMAEFDRWMVSLRKQVVIDDDGDLLETAPMMMNKEAR